MQVGMEIFKTQREYVGNQRPEDNPTHWPAATNPGVRTVSKPSAVLHLPARTLQRMHKIATATARVMSTNRGFVVLAKRRSFSGSGQTSS